ncbi:inosine-5-monophosphate dehydrogenase [Paramagnetospirillum marisnigri]|uniref:Inosine-5-monophosphate dehydrogenase n=1 Tax=Paramagnetospirillum marisnigri TaxID=1285242 RepID=A0A178M3Z8_9PROT|nr:CBS domain-containing protein [Paramagnetospirillum marisnigri]OAN42980.1 inosine-5-monophosphate dehydrogenase [Paramagnetospirillum marisnigri]
MPNRLIRDVIKSQTILTLPPTATVRQATREMKSRHVGAVMITDDAGRLSGIFTERDALFRVLAEARDPDATPLSSVMTPAPAAVSPDRKLGHALHLMHDGGFRHMPVVEAGIPVGMVSIRDALGKELSSFEREVAAKEDLSEILG